MTNKVDPKLERQFDEILDILRVNQITGEVYGKALAKVRLLALFTKHSEQVELEARRIGAYEAVAKLDSVLNSIGGGETPARYLMTSNQFLLKHERQLPESFWEANLTQPKE